MGPCDLVKRPPGPARHVQEANVRAVLAHVPGDRRDDLAPHHVGGAAKQQLDAELVLLGGVRAEVAVGLPVERAPVVGRVALLVDHRDVLVVVRAHAPQHARDVRDQSRQRAQVAARRDIEQQLARIQPGLDVREIARVELLAALQQRAKLSEREARPRLPRDHPCGLLHHRRVQQEREVLRAVCDAIEGAEHLSSSIAAVASGACGVGSGRPRSRSRGRARRGPRPARCRSSPSSCRCRHPRRPRRRDRRPPVHNRWPST